MKTKIKLPSATLALGCALIVPSLALARTVSGNYTLTSDEDWSEDGVITLDSATIDLAGYSLKVHGLDGSGTIVDSSKANFSDLTSPSGTAFAQGDALTKPDEYPPSKVFNDDVTDYIVRNSSIATYVAVGYDFGSEKVVNGYRINPGNNNNIRDGWPKNWLFQGSNTGTDNDADWDTLDIRTDATMSLRSWSEVYCFNSASSYRYYRLKVTEAQGGTSASRFNMAELEMGRVGVLHFDISGLAESDLSNISFSGASVVTANMESGDSCALTSDLDLGGMEVTFAGTIDLAGHTLTVNNLTGGGTVTDTSVFDKTTKQTDGSNVTTTTNGVSYAAQQPGWKAFGDFESYSSSGDNLRVVFNNVTAPPVDLDYNFGNATVVDSFRLKLGTVASTAPERAPKHMVFYGYDGSDWKKLGEWTGETDWAANEERYYDFANTNAYTKYRLSFVDNNGAKGGKGGILFEFFKLEYGCRAEAGKLVVNVPAGSTVENTDVALQGNLRFVTVGGGTFIASKAGQTYSGGTEVRDGTVKCGTANNDLFGRLDGEVQIMKDGSFETDAKNGNVGKYFFSLYGGRLAEIDTVVSSGSSYQRILDLALKGDSTFDAEMGMYIGSSTSGINSYIDLGGHAFSGTIGDGKFLRLDSVTMENGTFAVTGDGGFLLARAGVVATNVDFRLNCAIVVQNNTRFSVRDYEALGGTRSTSTQSGTMAVYGTFTPTSDSFYGCTLMDGSTLDLSTRSTTLNPYSDFTAGATTLKFEENATVNIVLGSRRTGNAPIMSWTAETKPANIDTVKFVRADADRSYSLVVKSDGLYAGEGLTITFY